MTGLDQAIWIALPVEALLLVVLTVRTIRAKPKPGVTFDPRSAGMAWLTLGFGLVLIGILALAACFVPWTWAKIAILVAALWLPGMMLVTIVVGGPADWIGSKFKGPKRP